MARLCPAALLLLLGTLLGTGAPLMPGSPLPPGPIVLLGSLLLPGRPALAGDHVPALLWSTARYQWNPEPALHEGHIVSAQELAVLLQPVFSPSPRNLVLFLQEMLSIDDFTYYSESYGNKNPFQNVQEILRSSPSSLVLPAVDSKATRHLLSFLQESGDWNLTNVTDLDISHLEVNTSKPNLLVVQLQPLISGLSEISTLEAMAENDKIIGRLTMDLEERGIHFSAIYTAVRPSRISRRTEMMWNLRRQLMATEEEDSLSYPPVNVTIGNTTCILFYAGNFSLKANNSVFIDLTNATFVIPNVDISSSKCSDINTTLSLKYTKPVNGINSLEISFLRIYSIHTKQASAENEDVSRVEFHLHGGTCYGRGIGVLPESHPDVKELKTFLESVELADSQSTDSMSLLELDSTSNNITDLESQRCQQLSVTVLTDHQDLSNTALKTIRNSRAPQQYRIRAKLRTFKPQKLYQSIKLHCSKCNSLQEVPDGDAFDLILQGCAVTPPNPELHSTSWYESVMWTTQGQKQRKITIHFVKHDEMLLYPEDTLVMIEGGTSKEIWKLTTRFKCVIPVRSTKNDLELLDLSAPFLLQGKVKYYGCNHCSTPKPIKNLSSLAAEPRPSWEPTEIAQALGIEPLQYVFIMKFTLIDGTGALNAYLFDYEKFFQIPASEILSNNFLQQKMQMTMNTLCPPGRKLDDLPWLECFIKSYNITDGKKQQVYYQIFDTTVAEDVV